MKKNQSAKKKGINSKTEVKAIPVNKPKVSTGFFNKTFILLFTIVLLLISGALFSNKLVFRHKYDPDEKDYTIILFLAVVALIILLSLVKTKKIPARIFIYPLIALQLGFTLYYEQPDSHSSLERELMNSAAELFPSTYFNKQKVFCSHNWYYWACQRNSFDTTVAAAIDSSSIIKSKPGDILIWDAHYTQKHYSNVDLNFFASSTELIPVTYYEKEVNQLFAMVFIKAFAEPEKNRQLFQQLIQKDSNNAKLYYHFGFLEYNKYKNFQAAIQYFSKALEMDANLNRCYYFRALAYLQSNMPDKGCADLKTAERFGIVEAKNLLATYCVTNSPAPAISTKPAP